MSAEKHQSNTSYHPTFLAAFWDAWKAVREGKQGIAQRQHERLQALVSYARTHSRYFADVYRDVPEPCMDEGKGNHVTDESQGYSPSIEAVEPLPRYRPFMAGWSHRVSPPQSSCRKRSKR
jgi:hypothetical protein